MKKFIATAALVAASTALSSAATIFFSVDGFVPAHSTSDTDINVNFALYTGEKSITDTVTAGASNSSFNTDNGSGFVQKISGKIVSGNTDSNGITFTVTNGHISAVRQNSNDPAYTNIVKSADGTESTNDDSIAYFSADSYAAGTYTVVFGDLYWYQRNSSYTASSSDHLGAIQYFTFTLSNALGANDYAEITITDSSKTFAGTTTQTTGLTNTFATFSIPEPSAFGLLAGIGALAFAVSRRRRAR